MKIAYNIAGTYRSGGMERVLACKANWLASHGYEVIVITTDQCGRSNFFMMDQRIKHIDLGIYYEENNGGSFANKLIKYPFKQFRHFSRLRKCLRQEQPDIVISMFCNDASLVPYVSGKAKTILEIHFSRFKRLQYNRAGLWGIADKARTWLDNRLINHYDQFVVLTEEDRDLWGRHDNLSVIPNAKTFSTDVISPLTDKTVLAVGRYTYQKGFDMLIQAWNLVAKENPDWRLRIVGDGEDREFLNKRIQDYGLEDKIILGGCEHNMVDVYRHSSILAFPSRYEGFGLVIVEAESMGIPVVSFACKCGPRDIITDGIDGFLIEEGDITGMADKLFDLMKDDEMRKRMGEAARLNSERFSEETIMKKWTDLFTRL